MITRYFFNLTWSIVGWVLRVSSGSLRLPVEVVNGGVWLIDYFFTEPAELFFFFVRPATFWVVMDFLFLYWAYAPIKKIMSWAVKKIPFMGIH